MSYIEFMNWLLGDGLESCFAAQILVVAEYIAHVPHNAIRAC